MSTIRSASSISTQMSGIFDGPPVELCFEIQFLVAQKREGQFYESDSDSIMDSDYGPYNQPLWSCPPGANPYEAIIQKCATVFSSNQEPHSLRYTAGNKEYAIMRSVGPFVESERFGYWTLQPSIATIAKDGSPGNYDWHGVSLRSPFQPQGEFLKPKPAFKWLLAEISRTVRIHVNSTCKHNILVRPSTGKLDLVAAQKLTTMVLMTERPLLKVLCPDVPHSGRNNLLYDTLATKFDTTKELADLRPVRPAAADLMDQHIPTMKDMELQKRIQAVWCQTSLQNLQIFLNKSDATEAAFTLRLFSNPDDPPAMEFRYAIWHPYFGRDVFEDWNLLAITLLHTSQFDAEDFKHDVQKMDKDLAIVPSDKTESGHCQAILNRLHIPGFQWPCIPELYGPNRPLAPSCIDKHGFLGNMEEYAA